MKRNRLRENKTGQRLNWETGRHCSEGRKEITYLLTNSKEGGEVPCTSEARGVVSALWHSPVSEGRDSQLRREACEFDTGLPGETLSQKQQ